MPSAPLGSVPRDGGAGPFEAVFGFLRRFLVVHLTTRVDVKLSTYIFEKVLNLPMDFFERTRSASSPATCAR